MLCGLVFAGWPASAQLAESGWQIDEFAVVLDVQADGTVDVTETITVDFAEVSRRGIYRTIPVLYALPAGEAVPEGQTEDWWRVVELRLDQVTRNGREDGVEATQPDRFAQEQDLVIRVGEEDQFLDGVQIYELRYTIDGAMNRPDEGPELYWNATGNGWGVPMASVTVDVTGPGINRAICFAGYVGAVSPCGATTMGADGSIRFAASSLDRFEGVTVVVGFPPGAVTVNPPILEHRWSLGWALAGSSATIPVTALTSVLVLAGLISLIWRQGRDRVTRGGLALDAHVDGNRAGEAEARRRGLFEPLTVGVRLRPPEELRPGQLGLIVDERVDEIDVTGTIIDLAVRGHLSIEELPTTGILWFAKADFVLREIVAEAGADVDPTSSYEALLLRKLFDGRAEVRVSELSGTFAESYAMVVRAIYEDGRLRRWFNGRPDKVRSRWIGVGVVALILSIAAFVVGIFVSNMAVVAVPLVLGSLALLIGHRWMPHRTPKGSALLAETLGFREFIRTAEVDTMAFAERESIFLEYLPYAIVFGVVDEWANRFAALGLDLGAALSGIWIHPHGSSLDRMSSGLGTFTANIGSSMATAPPSSGGGGGFSGGGFSGGGFGGGGGGSW